MSRHRRLGPVVAALRGPLAAVLVVVLACGVVLAPAVADVDPTGAAEAIETLEELEPDPATVRAEVVAATPHARSSTRPAPPRDAARAPNAPPPVPPPER